MSKVPKRLCHILVTLADGFLVLYKVTLKETSGTSIFVRPIAWYSVLGSRPHDSYARQAAASSDMVYQGDSNDMQAEELDYAYIDNQTKDIDEGREIGTEDSDKDGLDLEDRGEDGGDYICEVEGYAIL
ncbi:hypothetical protein POSPLADRAFT_1149445 [Postia placenta MAD-698-R-SB12]|uniref:Uncharacterized protein n=1 Tax=Postia placenta MAD-698-R-SB12 TaxID=670580 RepID=A0A1X6MTW5_9APHY|nr:hypothetical protein POSPLADRAFT_1149445 [Postia placenta MAD-698-R-SB12]OSX59700.1 hypothetical protein POSPLADRAFT_1149445 [Postia placenta MAD-698-R-SB12]